MQEIFLQGCRAATSVRKGSFFSSSKLRLHQLMLVMYHWASDSPQWLVMREVRASHRTIVDWYNFLREVCVFLLLVFVHNGMMQTMVPKS